MIFKRTQSWEEKALTIFRKNGIAFQPGDFVETSTPVEHIEDRFSSFIKEIHLQKKKVKLYKYEKLEDREGCKLKYMVILDLNEKRFISHTPGEW